MDVDLFVIGGGSGGVRAARISASLGARVALAESGRMGGTCVNVGCVPKKLFSIGAQVPTLVEDAHAFGWSATTEAPDWPRLISNKDAEIARLNTVYGGILERAGVEVIRGHATLAGPHTVTVKDRQITARNILIATGGQPFVPPIPGREHGIVSDAVFSLPTLPDRIVVIGAGYIGTEFASIFNGYGADVDLVFRGPTPLRGFDDDVRTHLAEELAGSGICLHPGMTIREIRGAGAEKEVVLSGTEGEERVLRTDLVLFATGRVPNTAGLGLESVGVARRPDGRVRVDERFQSSVPSIYAVGDVSSEHSLTPVALAEGMNLARRLFGEETRVLSLDKVPTAVFCHPNVGTVGLTEQEARARGCDVTLYRARFRPMQHTLSGRNAKTLMKLVVDRQSDRVLGVHMVGPNAGEIIQGFAVAVQCGATKAQFDATIGIHPTAAEELVTMRTPVS